VSDWRDLEEAIKFYEERPDERAALVLSLQDSLVKSEPNADSFILHLSKALKDDLQIEL